MYEYLVKHDLSFRGWPPETRFPHENHAPDEQPVDNEQKATRNGIQCLRVYELQALAKALHTSTLQVVKGHQVDLVRLDQGEGEPHTRSTLPN